MTEYNTLPRISCLLPVYNGERFIDEAVRSILNQSLGNFELVIVDDGSTDGTTSRLQYFADHDPRVRVVRQRNGGIVSALNRGLSECRGTYIARMDADDVAEPDRFAFQADYLDTHPHCVLVGGFATSVRENGSPAERTTGGRHSTTDLSVFPPRIAVSMHPLIMVRHAALVEIGGYRGDFAHAEDYDLFIRLARLGTIDNPDRNVLLYRRHEGAISVRYMATQERNAARVEVDAIVEAGYPSVPDWLFEPYVRLRIWRRAQSVDPQRAVRMLRAVIRDLLTPAPRTLVSSGFLRLRAIIFWNLIRFGLRYWRTSR